ncbi:hypothetical protein [Shimia sp. MMG029]|uniref:hypothetical protein n=1 Tax=Shimia sp. MMG029 TaxID=3021978 RepID=UPI0022FE1FFD|nr:hypothetical protein [Shimia sp. MMG029]MDA5557192.1 hypothetical protein [Shimia sp. MMG029]
MKRLLFLCFGLAVTTMWLPLASTNASAAEHPKTVADYIGHRCPAEWKALDNHSLNNTVELKKITLSKEWADPLEAADAAARHTMIKPLLAIQYEINLFASITLMEDPENHTFEILRHTQLALNLSECLRTPPENKANVLALYAQMAPEISQSRIKELLRVADGLYCMKWDKALALYFAINPDLKNRHRDYIRIVNRTAKECTSPSE